MEPILIESAVYAFIIFVGGIVSYLTEPYLDDKLRDDVSKIKGMIIVGAYSLLALHTLGIMFIRVIRGLIKEIKGGDDDNDDDDNDEIKPRKLITQPAIDEDEIENFKKAKSNKVKEKRGK